MNPSFSGVYLLGSVFTVAVCGLIYELVAAALSSYLLGGSVTQFSLVIGIFLTAMGLGSYLTRYLPDDAADAFIAIQIAIGLVGGLSAPLLLTSFALSLAYWPVLVMVLTITGTLVGMEIPLLIRLLKDENALRITVSNVLALDYMGALIASVAFPLILVPYVGLLRTSLICGLLNIAVALLGVKILRPVLKARNRLLPAAVVSAVVLVAGLAASGVFTGMVETFLYQDRIVFAKQTPYQRIVVTRWRDDIRLFLDGHLQFSSIDEHRYHEALVHPAMAAAPGAVRALILGGGDGLTAREVLKYPRIQRIDLVDLDGDMIDLFTNHSALADLSRRALSDSRLTVHVQDAGKFLENSTEFWDVIFIDLPDPNNLSLARLYSTSFYSLVAKRLSKYGVIATQATSPFYAPDAFWCIAKTLETARVGPEGGLYVYPYHAHVPSFGDWGFILASRRPFDPASLRLDSAIPLKFLSQDLLPTLFLFPKDLRTSKEIQPNRLDNQIIMEYYKRSWKRFSQ